MEEQMEKLSAIAQAKPYKIIISKPAGGEIPYRRIVIERKESYYQAAAYTEKQVFHENIPPEKLAEYLGKTAVGQYLQVNAWDDAAEHIYLCSKKGKVTYKTKKNVQTAAKPCNLHVSFLNLRKIVIQHECQVRFSTAKINDVKCF